MSEGALAAIEKIGQATGLSATAVIEMTMREAAKRMDIRDHLGQPVTFDRIAQVINNEADYETGADPAKSGTDRSVGTSLKPVDAGSFTRGSGPDGLIPIRREYQSVEEASEEFPTSSMSTEAKAKRDRVKKEKAGRKAELRENVAKAVANPPARAAKFAGKSTVET